MIYKGLLFGGGICNCVQLDILFLLKGVINKTAHNRLLNYLPLQRQCITSYQQ